MFISVFNTFIGSKYSSLQVIAYFCICVYVFFSSSYAHHPGGRYTARYPLFIVVGSSVVILPRHIISNRKYCTKNRMKRTTIMNYLAQIIR